MIPQTKIDALVAIDKPKGLTSSDVVVRCRGALSRATGTKQKCGHMGTLDPIADGVLVLGFGRAARLFDVMQHKTKEYRARLEFGRETDTLDSEGKVVATTEVLPTEEAIKNALRAFTGTITQIPPKYSALNVNGVRAYDLARKGKDFEIPQRIVTVYSLTADGFEYTRNGTVGALTLDTVCGSGTYIRSLCRDIAASVGSLGCMTALRRTRCGFFGETDSIPLESFLSEPLSGLVPVEYALRKLLPCVDTDDKTTFMLKNGRICDIGTDDNICAVFNNGSAVGIAEGTRGKYKLTTRLCE